MKFRKAFLTVAAIAGLLAGGQAAYAQFTGAGITPNTHSADIVQVIPNGVVGPAEANALIGMVAGQTTYQLQTPLTGFTITAPNPNVASFLLLNPAGTLATGTLTLPAAPSDGGSFCVMSTQTQTALTVNGATGQTVAGTAVTALVAYVPACWRWWAATATWGRLGS